MEASIIIRFFNKDLDFIGEVDDFTSFIYERKWFTYSNFQLVVENFDKDLFQEGNYIVVNNDPYRSGQITKVNITDDTVTIKGFGIGFWFTDRITYPTINKNTFSMSDYAENIMYELIKFNAIDSNITNRNFQNLIVNSTQGRGEKIAFETRYKVLSDELETISKTSRLGWNIKFDYKNKRFIFESLVGIDRTVNQADVPPMIFSRRYDNILELEYTKDVSEYKNCAIVAGQGEGSNREIVIVNDNLSGQDRKELFVDARDIEDGTNLADRGKSKLAENTIIESFEATIDTESYRVEWDLGDFVTILDDEIGVISDTQIVEVVEIYEDGILSVEPVFGESISQFGDKFKQAIDNPIYETSKDIVSTTIPNSTGVKWLELIGEEA
ncbi:siphovirus ReqiPepy6 Gp37-like family protein [uncultured Clostridium sp.]|jgi:hypothetical protein|uniref:siphovirus ReqiPepy6 Gp37-like family protein n=1 Tax=uncultured Clostridium sp. TaxID=59620 RepID=UPI0025F94601|nr:siphovirus ReqiPepy6 Gp37-like family protein [uncultured Clostridium sp.]